MRAEPTTPAFGAVQPVGPATRQVPPLQKAIAAARMCRPYSLLWFVSLPTATMALWLGGGHVDVPRLLLLIATFALTDAGLTTWNDVCDVETDRASAEAQRNTRPLAAGVLSMRWGRTQVAVLESLALLAALAISPWFAGLLAGAVVYGIAYSGGPVYAGGRPLVSQAFWIVLWPGMYAGVALVMGGRLERGLLYVAGVILFMGVAETLAKDLRDLSNDTRAGKRTTPVAVGAGVAAGVAAVAFALGSLALVGASLLTPHWNPGLTVGLAVVLGLWCGRATMLARMITQAYSKQAARAMHVGAIRVFLAVNALFITGLTG